MQNAVNIVVCLIAFKLLCLWIWNYFSVVKLTSCRKQPIWANKYCISIIIVRIDFNAFWFCCIIKFGLLHHATPGLDFPQLVYTFVMSNRIWVNFVKVPMSNWSYWCFNDIFLSKLSNHNILQFGHIIVFNKMIHTYKEALVSWLFNVTQCAPMFSIRLLAAFFF